jgi:hypothetical protein
MSWRSRFLAWVTPILLLAQIALAVHQLEHRIAPDALTVAHECVLCNVTTGAAPPPAPFVILPPDFGPAVPADAVLDAACCTHVATAFLSRAPPVSAAL